MQTEGGVVRLANGPAEHEPRFDTFVEEEHVRLFKALSFVTGSREEAEMAIRLQPPSPEQRSTEEVRDA